MPSKEEATYNKVLDSLRQFDICPTRIIIDFEKAEENSLRRAFPNARVTGCYQHFVRCCWRKINELGWARQYRHDPEFARNVKLFTALAFVPTDDVVDMYDRLSMQFALQYANLGNLQAFFEYYANTWIGRWDDHRLQIQHRRWIDPLFAIDMWNCHDSTLDYQPRTNNNVEARNRVFQQTVGIEHPQVYRLIAELITENELTRAMMAAAMAGRAAPVYSKPRYAAHNRQLQHILAFYHTYLDPIAFLHACSYHFEY
jgi:hypothetical protein